jgi:hypothetical protein
MTIKYTEWIQNIQNRRKIDQMVIKYTKTRHSKIYPNWDFWFENIPSGNPAEPQKDDEMFCQISAVNVSIASLADFD